MALPVLKEELLLDLTVGKELVATLDMLAYTGASQLDWEWGTDHMGYGYVKLYSRELKSITTDEGQRIPRSDTSDAGLRMEEDNRI